MLWSYHVRKRKTKLFGEHKLFQITLLKLKLSPIQSETKLNDAEDAKALHSCEYRHPPSTIRRLDDIQGDIRDRAPPSCELC